MVSAMAGELNEISRVIGGLEEGVRNLSRTFTQHCEDDDRRHTENLDAMRALNENISKLNRRLTPFEIAQWKKSGAWMLALAILGTVGGVVYLIAGEIIKLIVARWH
jgi:hypothetical protein